MENRTKHRRNELLFAALVLVNSIWIFTTYLSVTHIGTFEPATLVKSIEGTAERPYVMRVLVPWLAKVIAPLLPVPLAELLHKSPSPFGSTLNVLSGGKYPREAAIVLVLMFASLLGFAYAERSFLHALNTSPKEQFILPLFAQILILPFSFFFAYFYDFPQIFLVTLSLLFLKQERWKSYLITLALASLNKETSLFLIVVFFVYYIKRLPRNQFLPLLIAQTSIYGFMRAGLLFLFRNNVGAPAFLTLRNHYQQYSAYPSTLIFTLLFFLILGFLIWRNWTQKHPFLHASIVIPILILILFFTSGMPMEFRVFLDALPALVILIFPSLQTSPAALESKASSL